MMSESRLRYLIDTLDYDAASFEDFANRYRDLCTVDEYEDLAMQIRRTASRWRAELNAITNYECA